MGIMRIFRTISSFSAAYVIYILTNPFHWNISDESMILCSCGIFIIFFLISCWISRYYEKINPRYRDTLKICEIQPAEQEILPIYVGLFVILLSINSLSLILQLFIIILLFLLWLCFLEQSYYFNIFWIIRYRLYKVKDCNGNMYYVYIRDDDLKMDPNQDELGLKNLVRINNFTFILIGRVNDNSTM